jgi:hypothetical protein
MTDGLGRARWVFIAVAFTLMGAMHGYFDDVFVPAQEAKAPPQPGPRGNLSDLYIRWRGAQELLLHNRDPYSADVTADLQKGYFGRALDAKNPGDPVDEARFAYPLYVVFLLAPTIKMEFATVQMFYTWFAVACTVASVWCWLHVFGGKASFTTMAVASMLLLGSFPVVQALHLQQPALIVAPLLAAAVAAAASGVYWAAGIALGLAMIKPQTALPIAGWLLLWSVSGWKQRKFLPLAFIAVMAALTGGAELLLPGWIWEWRDAVVAYAGYNGGTPTHVQLLFGSRVGWLVTFVLVAGMGFFCWKARRDAASSDRFKLACALAPAVFLVVTPLWHEYDLLFLLPAALLAFQWRAEFFRLNFPQRALLSVSAIALGWQWAAALAVRTVAFASPALARNWTILPWLSVFFAPTLAVAGLVVIARARLTRTEL